MEIRSIAIAALCLLLVQVCVARPEEETKSDASKGFQDLIRSPTSPACKQDVSEFFHVAKSIVSYNVENLKFAGRLFVDYFKCIGNRGIVSCSKDVVRSYATLIQQTFSMNIDYIRDLLLGIVKIIKSCLSISKSETMFLAFA